MISRPKNMFASIICSPCFGSILGMLVLIKLWMKLTSGRFKGDVQMLNTTAVVTGANSGIGVEVAKDFARRGAKVVMVCRDMKKAERVREDIIKETKNTNISLKHVDFASLASVRKCAKEILAEESSIQILLNNAGILVQSSKNTEDGVESMMQINHFGPFLFTNLLLGRLKESAPSRIVNVVSDANGMAKIDVKHPDLSSSKSLVVVYGTSKLCSSLATVHLADKLLDTGVTVTAVIPGQVHSDITRNMNALMRIPWKFICKYLLKSSEEGAQTLIYACISPDIANVTGKHYKDCALCSDSKITMDKDFAKKVWDHSEKVVNLTAGEKFY